MTNRFFRFRQSYWRKARSIHIGMFQGQLPAFVGGIIGCNSLLMERRAIHSAAAGFP
jgi:hypothetical protein